MFTYRARRINIEHHYRWILEASNSDGAYWVLVTNMQARVPVWYKKPVDVLNELRQREAPAVEEDPMFTPDDPCDCEECWQCELQREAGMEANADMLAEMSMEQL